MFIYRELVFQDLYPLELKNLDVFIVALKPGPWKTADGKDCFWEWFNDGDSGNMSMKFCMAYYILYGNQYYTCWVIRSK